MATLNLQVGASADDVYHRLEDGTTHSFSTNNTILYSGRYDTTPDFRYGGVCRFSNVTIPQGSTIDSAELTITATANNSATVVRTNIACEDVDNADTIDDDAEYDALSLTTPVAWDEIGAWTTDTEYTSPAIASAVEIVTDRGGWSSGNALNVDWRDDDSDSGAGRRRRGYSYDGDSAKAPKLDIDYTAAVGVTPPRVMFF